MKASLKIAGDKWFCLYLTPETDAEREILKRVAECKELTNSNCLRYPGHYTDTDHLEIKRLEAQE